jgi:hypothetical protein
MKPSKWIELIDNSINKNFKLETTEGVVRQGKISGVSRKTFHLNGELVDFPFEIEINGDHNDRVPLDRLQSMTIY